LFVFSLLILSFVLPYSAEALMLHAPLLDSPVTLDWNGSATLLEAPLILNLCEGLFRVDPVSLKILPALAEKVSKSKDLKEYTFYIRSNAKWSDGREILAQDFVDAWMRVISPQSTSIYMYYLFDVLNAKEYQSKKIKTPETLGFYAKDKHTLVVKLIRPIPDWEINTTFWPLFPNRKDQIEKFGDNWWRAGALVSSGPFIFDSYEAGKRAVLKRNIYYPTSSNVDEIDFLIVPNSDEALDRYDAKGFDFLWGIPLFSLGKMISRKDYHPQNLMRIHLLALNSERFPMSNKEFRKAILGSIDPKKVLTSQTPVLRIANTLIPAPLPGSQTSSQFHYNPALAKESLERSGIVINKTTKLRILTSLSEPFLSTSKSIQTQITENLGMNVEVSAPKSMEFTAYMDLGEYDATLISWTAKVFASQDFLLPYSGEATFNRMHYSNAIYDQWIFQGIESLTSNQKEHAFDEAQKLLIQEDAVAMPLFFENSAYLAHPWVKGIQFNSMGIPLLGNVTLQAKNK